MIANYLPFIILVFTGVLCVAFLLRNRRPVAPRSITAANRDCDESESHLTQELYRISQRLEQRVESLETILLDCVNTTRHPVGAESEES